MNKETRAIILIFEGTEVSEETLDVIASAISAQCNTMTVDNFVYSSKEIADAIMKSDLKCSGTKPAPVIEEKRTAEDEAIIYIGTIMEEDLKKPFNKYALSGAIIDKIKNYAPGSAEATRFINALFILSQENLEVSRSLMKKYHFSIEKIAIFKKVYNTLVKI